MKSWALFVALIVFALCILSLGARPVHAGEDVSSTGPKSTGEDLARARRVRAQPRTGGYGSTLASTG
jgi:hypothetical protein